MEIEVYTRKIQVFESGIVEGAKIFFIKLTNHDLYMVIRSALCQSYFIKYSTLHLKSSEISLKRLAKSGEIM